MVVGVVVARRRPANAIGWLFLLIGLSGTTAVFGVTYAAFAERTGAPGGPIAAWYSTCETIVGSGLGSELLGVVGETMAPSHASFWLRKHAR